MLLFFHRRFGACACACVLVAFVCMRLFVGIVCVCLCVAFRVFIRMHVLFSNGSAIALLSRCAFAILNRVHTHIHAKPKSSFFLVLLRATVPCALCDVWQCVNRTAIIVVFVFDTQMRAFSTLSILHATDKRFQRSLAPASTFDGSLSLHRCVNTLYGTVCTFTRCLFEFPFVFGCRTIFQNICCACIGACCGTYATLGISLHVELHSAIQASPRAWTESLAHQHQHAHTQPYNAINNWLCTEFLREYGK